MIPLESPVPEIGPPGSESGGRKRTHGTRPAARLRKRRISHRPLPATRLSSTLLNQPVADSPSVSGAFRRIGSLGVPTTFVRKYTPRAQRKPPGGSRAGRRARETGGVGETGAVLSGTNARSGRTVQQHGNMTRSVFRICQTKRSKPHSMDRPVDRGEARPSASNDFIEERRTARRKLMSVLQRGDHPVVRELSRLGRSLGVRRGRARPDLRSAPPRGPRPGARGPR